MTVSIFLHIHHAYRHLTGGGFVFREIDQSGIFVYIPFTIFRFFAPADKYRNRTITLSEPRITGMNTDKGGCETFYFIGFYHTFITRIIGSDSI